MTLDKRLLDLVVVGGLAIDRFPDGSEAPGGSVLHAARALAMAGLRGATITVAGPESVATAGVKQLRSFGGLVVCEAPWSIRFSIDERPARRVMLYEAGARLTLSPANLASLPSRALLIAPIAGELDAVAVAATSAVGVRIAALQGWLRTLVPGEPVTARPLAGLGGTLADALRAMAALVASDEDLAAGPPDASRAMTALRDWAGGDPVLAVTAGEAGVLLDLPVGGRALVPAPIIVTGVSTVGAGDAFAALFAVGLGRGIDPVGAARQAAAGVSRWLTARAGATAG